MGLGDLPLPDPTPEDVALIDERVIESQFGSLIPRKFRRYRADRDGKLVTAEERHTRFMLVAKYAIALYMNKQSFSKTRRRQKAVRLTVEHIQGEEGAGGDDTSDDEEHLYNKILGSLRTGYEDRAAGEDALDQLDHDLELLAEYYETQNEQA
jgi:hypothetical protein